MAKKAKILNKKDELPTDAIAISKDEVWNAKEIAVESETKITDDVGVGETVILRSFEFGVNPQAFQHKKPTSQEIFNSHLRGIESMLWADGLKPTDDVEPRLIFSKDKTHYRIFVAAKPMRGHILREKPKTLSEIFNGNTSGNKV